MTNYQCPSCGGFCKKSACERVYENPDKFEQTKKKFISMDNLLSSYGVSPIIKLVFQQVVEQAVSEIKVEAEEYVYALRTDIAKLKHENEIMRNALIHINCESINAEGLSSGALEKIKVVPNV